MTKDRQTLYKINRILSSPVLRPSMTRTIREILDEAGIKAIPRCPQYNRPRSRTVTRAARRRKTPDG